MTTLLKILLRVSYAQSDVLCSVSYAPYYRGSHSVSNVPSYSLDSANELSPCISLNTASPDVYVMILTIYSEFRYEFFVGCDS